MNAIVMAESTIAAAVTNPMTVGSAADPENAGAMTTAIAYPHGQVSWAG